MKQVSILNLHECTPIEVFDFVSNHLLTQKVRSIVGSSYKYKNGDLKCAAGCLIPDEKYDPKFEGKNWKGLVDNDFAPKDHFHLIMELQSIHDNTSPEFWEYKLNELEQRLWNIKKEI